MRRFSIQRQSVLDPWLGCACALGLLAGPLGAQAAEAVNTIDTSAFVPPSPDPAGITWIDTRQELFVTDSEVNEMPLYTGSNVFRIGLTGPLLGLGDTTHFSIEPTGVSWDPVSGAVFITDDDTQLVNRVDPGVDGLHGTLDDIVTSFSTVPFGLLDPEGVSIDSLARVLFIAGGMSDLVYRMEPGANGVFDGLAPAGDDLVTSFDTSSLGLTDPEGIAVDPASGELYVVGQPADRLLHCTGYGDPRRLIDMAPVAALKPAGLTFAPATNSPAVLHLYLADRGVDNNFDPNENDGRLFEIKLPQPGINLPPVLSAGADQQQQLGDVASLVGSASDDGLPNPPGMLTSTWTLQDGPGIVAFGDPSSVATSATFTAVGVYRLRLTVDDGEFQTSDELRVTVDPPGVAIHVDQRILTGMDDAEESVAGEVSLTSSDLELVYDNRGDQQVGLRFSQLGVPQGVEILEAWVQFEVDETTFDPTSLVIEAESVDDSAPFISAPLNISTRPRSLSAVGWNPLAWTPIGLAGPEQRTPDLSALIQEIVDRPGWGSGHALTLVITGTGERVATAYNGDPAGAPLLHVVYVEFDPPLSVDAGDPIYVYVTDTAQLAGTLEIQPGSGLTPAHVTSNWSLLTGPSAVNIGDPAALQTTANFSLPGVYTLRLEASAPGVQVHDDVVVTVLDPGGVNVLGRRIATGPDDAEERASGPVKLGARALRMVDDRGNVQTVGLRFDDVGIPQGAAILSASVQFQARALSDAPAALLLEAHATDDAAPFVAAPFSVSGPPRTLASVAWSPPAWSSIGQAGVAERTPDLTAILQELVDRPGWNAGNAIAFVVSGSSVRVAESVEGSAAGAALLQVEFQ